MPLLFGHTRVILQDEYFKVKKTQDMSSITTDIRLVPPLRWNSNQKIASIFITKMCIM